mmetsp:Transcript_2619/g.7423  ORF Transcript_2619/g.7423 Transcript_2619/m.7423 type:complete len:94 (-) Transcript_2619:97-378(-)
MALARHLLHRGASHAAGSCHHSPGAHLSARYFGTVATNTSLYLRNLSNGAEVFLIGTAHVSKKSAEEVRCCSNQQPNNQITTQPNNPPPLGSP